MSPPRPIVLRYGLLAIALLAAVAAHASGVTRRSSGSGTNGTQSYATNRPVNDPSLDANTSSRRDAQTGPSIAMWGNYALAGWNDGRGSTPGETLPNFLNYGYSTDGGQTFKTGSSAGVPDLPVLLLGGVWIGDPTVTVNEKTGEFYFCGTYDPPNGGLGPDENAVAVAKATFSGTSIVWTRPVLVRSLVQEVVGLPEVDKPWIAADSASGNVYVSYTRHTASDDSILFSRSTDGGAHWSPSITLSADAAAGRVDVSRIAVGPDGEVYVAWKEVVRAAPPSPDAGADFFRIRRSNDGGVGFDPEQTAAKFFDNFGTGAPGFNREQGVTQPSIAVDRSNRARGRIYMAWNETVNFYDSFPDSATASAVITEPEPRTSTTGSDDTPATAIHFTPGDALFGSFNQQVNGTGDFDDFDYYSFDAIRGTTYLFLADELPTQYTLRLFGTDGVSRLALTGDRSGAGPGLIVWTCPRSGTYFLRMAIFGSAPGYYRVDTRVDTPGGANQRARDQRDVFVASSPDGSSWSTPVLVSGTEPPWFDDWLPEVAVAGDGAVYAAWYDFADAPLSTDGAQSRVYMARSDDDGVTWATLGPVGEVLTDWTNSDSNIFPNQGDYLSLVANATTVTPCWTDGRAHTLDIWTAPFALGAIQIAIEAVVVDTTSVTLTWRAQAPAPSTAQVVRAEGQGGYATLGTVTFDGNGRATFVDGAFQPGTQYRYALQLVVGASTETLGEWTVLTLGVARTPLDFTGAIPNPAKKDGLRVRFALPDGEPARLRLYDITGRQLRSRSYSGSGSYDVDFGTGLDLKPGIYLLRLTHGGYDAFRRVSIVPG